MGKPENINDFTEFIVENTPFYVENRVLKEYTEGNRITFYMDEYGKFELEMLE